MKIILQKDVTSLGEEGDIKVVADGYARNFLIPKKLALPYTKANAEILKQRQNAIEQRKEEKRKEAMSLKEKIAAESLVLEMPAGEKGKLFGAVTSAMIVDELARKGITVERKRVEVPDHSLKVVGGYVVNVRLYGGEQAELKVEVKSDGSTPQVTEAPPEPEVFVEEPADEDDSEETAEATEDIVDEAAADGPAEATEDVVNEAAAEGPAETSGEAADEAAAEAAADVTAQTEDETAAEAAAEEAEAGVDAGETSEEEEE